MLNGNRRDSGFRTFVYWLDLSRQLTSGTIKCLLIVITWGVDCELRGVRVLSISMLFGIAQAIDFGCCLLPGIVQIIICLWCCVDRKCLNNWCRIPSIIWNFLNILFWLLLISWNCSADLFRRLAINWNWSPIRFIGRPQTCFIRQILLLQ